MAALTNLFQGLLGMALAALPDFDNWGVGARWP